MVANAWQSGVWMSGGSDNLWPFDRKEWQWSPTSFPHRLSFLRNVLKTLVVAKRTHANYDLCTEKVTSQWHGGRGERYDGESRSRWPFLGGRWPNKRDVPRVFWGPLSYYAGECRGFFEMRRRWLVCDKKRW